jgi:ubiquinol-cytochrome c reductase cytochrome c1 subunit
MTFKLLSKAAPVAKMMAVATFAGALLAGGSALAATHPEEPANIKWSFEGPFGKFDQAQLQRGYRVYREVCAGCHSMKLVSFRNLGQKGGPFFDPEFPNANDNPYVKVIAAEYQVNDIDSETGDVIQRPATSADRFPAPFPNDAAARASNGGALPPDLSVIAKARSGGPDYIHALLTGYRDPPEGLTVDPGKFYNPWFPGDLTSSWAGDHSKVPPGGVIGMVPPLADGQVTFDDGTPSTVDQMSLDVSAFLMWAAEPKLNERHQMGAAVMIYLLLLSGLLYASYRRVWKNESH